MSNAKDGSGKHISVSGKPPQQKFSIFSKGPQFGVPQKLGGQKQQFKPPAPRITQNKGGGGK